MSLVLIIFGIVLLSAAVATLMIVKYALEEWRESREEQRNRQKRKEERREKEFDELFD